MASQKISPRVSDPYYRKCTEYLERGFEIEKTDGLINKAAFIPLEKKQPSFKLFEIDPNDRDVLVFTPSTEYNTEVMSGESLKEFATEASLKLEYDQQSRVMKKTAGLCVSTGLGFSTESKNRTIYHLHHEKYKFGFMNFDVETARSCLITTVRDELNNVHDAKTAKIALRKYGVGYINQLILGGQFEASCSIERSHFMTKSDVEAEVASKVSTGKTGVSQEETGAVTITITRGGKKSKTVMRTKAIGGDLLKLSDVEAWKKSVADNPEVVGYDVEPLYSLVKSNSAAYQHLKAVFDKMVEEFPLPPDKVNLATENYYVSVKHHEDWLGYTQNADIKLCYSNTSNVISKGNKSRSAFFAWRSQVRKNNSKFAENNETDRKFSSDKPISSIEDIPKM